MILPYQTYGPSFATAKEDVHHVRIATFLGECIYILWPIMVHWEMKPNHLPLLRVWHHENYIVHGDGKAPITVSITCLCSYVDSFLGCNGSIALHPKGKSPLLRDQSFIFLGPSDYTMGGFRTGYPKSKCGRWLGRYEQVCGYHNYYLRLLWECNYLWNLFHRVAGQRKMKSWRAWMAQRWRPWKFPAGVYFGNSQNFWNLLTYQHV
jgi:hypothetical protein